jgi:hypothetical protein
MTLEPTTLAAAISTTQNVSEHQSASMIASSSLSCSAPFACVTCVAASLLIRRDVDRTGIIPMSLSFRNEQNVTSLLCSYWLMSLLKASLNKSASSPRPFSQYSRTYESMPVMTTILGIRKHQALNSRKKFSPSQANSMLARKNACQEMS